MFFRTESERLAAEKRNDIVNQFLGRLNELEDQGQFASALQERFSEAKQINILSIGCGDEPYELDALKLFFNQHPFAFNYIGVDVLEDDIKKCKSNYQESNVKFQVMDGMNYTEIQKLFNGEDIHIIIMRHPLLFKDNPQTKPVAEFFDRIFTTTVPYLLAEGGDLIVSLYHPEEQSDFLRLTQLISDAPPVALSESKAVFYEKECVVTGLGDMPRDVYSDRFFYALPDFQPNLVMRAEKERGTFETEHDHLQPIIQQLAATHEKMYHTRNSSDLTSALLNHVIKEAIQWRKDHPTETALPKLAEVITQHLSDDVPPAKIDALQRIAFDLFKRPINEVNGPMNRKKYISVANAIMETVMQGGDLNDCYKALAVVSARPIFLPQAPKSTKEPKPYLPGLGM